MKPHGWLADEESRWLAEQAHTKELVIEFGSWCGRSTLALSCAKRVVCVDTWLGTQNDHLGNHADLIANGLNPVAEWRVNTKHLPNVIGIVGNLRDPAVEEMLVASYARKADMIFIDADHSLEAITKDIWLAKRLLSRDGVLCGHDFHHNHPGVQQAVSTMLPYYTLPAGTIWKAS
jgi:hypothetical protein